MDDSGHQSDGGTPVEVKVDLDGLGGFKTFLSKELQLNIEPIGNQIIAGHNLGIGFGPNYQSEQVSMAQLKYSEQVSQSSDNMQKYIQFVQVLVETIQLVIEKYIDSDMTADDMMNIIQNKLNAAEAPNPYMAAL
jgi:hypothetical protein